MIEVTVWVGATLAAVPLAQSLRRRLGSRLAGWEAEIAFWSAAAYGVLPLYGAWISGAVIGRDCGLTGFTPAAWLRGIAICALLLGALGFGLRSPALRRLAGTWFSPGGSWLVLFDEPRWALYRGAGSAFFPSALAAQLIGLTLGALEWLIRGGRPARVSDPAVALGLIRLAGSALLFALTHNLWLIVITQAAALALIRRSTGTTMPG